ncbi:MAG: MMPL family transporter, partial [Actinocatenispora sp.]
LRKATADLASSLRRTAGVAAVRSPLDPGGDALVSADGRSGLVRFQVDGPDERLDAHYDAVVRAVRAVAHRNPRIRLAQSGDRTLSTVVDESIKDDFGRAERTSLPLTGLILLVVFGSLIAAGIPVLLTLTTVVATFSLLQVVDHWLPINSATSSMVLLVGVAVGIDYCLFYLRREREERAAGRGVREALRITARTSGRVVLVAGLTVMLCLSGLLFTGIDAFRGLAVGTILIVGLAMIGSVTALPALLASLGSWVDRCRIPWLGRRRTAARESRVWTAVARAVTRRPALWATVTTLAMLVVAVPALGLRMQDAAVTDSLPRSVPQIDATVRMQQAFPGAASPERVVIWRENGGTVDDPALRSAIADLRGRIAERDHRPTASVPVARVGRVLVARVPLPGSGTDPTSDRALLELRDHLLPDTLGRVDGVGYSVTGRTAFAHDFTDQLGGRILLVVVFVLVLAFVLVVLVFRSLAIPVVSILLNLLSVAATLGVVTWVFQDGHLAGLLGARPYGGVVSWEPLFMFVLLFGLSIDYHLFILSRIRERWQAGAGPRAAIVGGIGTSSGVVTSAAVIMTAVFLVLGTLTAVEYRILGVGMAVAVVLDATVVRGVLLPATMALLGDRAWTLPRCLW